MKYQYLRNTKQTKQEILSLCNMFGILRVGRILPQLRGFFHRTGVGAGEAGGAGGGGGGRRLLLGVCFCLGVAWLCTSTCPYTGKLLLKLH